jgi:hypothetical protein
MSLSATTSPTSDDAYECAAGLIRSLLGGVELPSPPARPVELLHRERTRKVAFLRAIRRHRAVPALTTAFRIADAAYPYLAPDGRCTDRAVSAATTALHGATAHLPRRQRTQLHADVNQILASAQTVLLHAR